MVVVLALCAVTAWYVRDIGNGPTVQPAAGETPEKPAGVARENSQPSAVRLMPVATKREVSGPEAALPESLKHLLAYEASDNLAELMAQLAPVAGTGDPGAKWIVAKILEECWGRKIVPNQFQSSRKDAETLPEPQRTAKIRHLSRNERRCSQLIAEGRVTREEKERATEAVLQGIDLASEALRLNNPYEPMTVDAVKALQRRIVASRDPWAIWAMAEVMGSLSAEVEQIYGPYSGTKIDHWAWKLVACRLGYPCGPDSMEVRTLCIVLGQCINEGVPGLIQYYYLAPNDYERAQAAEQKLLGLIAAGNVNEIFP